MEPDMLNRQVADGDEQDSQERADNDGSWKDLIENLWPEFIKRTLPELYVDVDLSKPPEFLSQELRDPLPDAEKHNPACFVDELLKVFLLNGEHQWVYLHIEVQGPGGENVSWRMFSYCCYIVAHYKEMPVALVVLTSPRPLAERQQGNPSAYETQRYGMLVNYRYSCVELYKLDDDELLNSDDPIDLAFYAAKKAATCRDKERQKFKYLRELTRLLAEKGWDEERRRTIFAFTARIINLKDPELKTRYVTELEASKEANKLESFVEKYFREKGFTQGLAEGRVEGLAEGRSEMLNAATSFMKEHGLSPELISQFTASLRD